MIDVLEFWWPWHCIIQWRRLQSRKKKERERSSCACYIHVHDRFWRRAKKKKLNIQACNVCFSLSLSLSKLHDLFKMSYIVKRTKKSTLSIFFFCVCVKRLLRKTIPRFSLISVQSRDKNRLISTFCLSIDKKTTHTIGEKFPRCAESFSFRKTGMLRHT